MSDYHSYASQALYKCLICAAPEFFRSKEEAEEWQIGCDSISVNDMEDACDAASCALLYAPNRGWFVLMLPELEKVTRIT